MKITFHQAKRDATLIDRGLDFADADKVFAGKKATLLDDRKDYGEVRYQTYGTLNRRIVLVVWTPRPPARHIISMRHCHEDEAAEIRTLLR